ncbi:c-type cytochrome [Zhouia amylolytica]|uniref:Cytochrome c class i n=1 Tax=Zhouia amylolytica AD3 TaxID=1286632 RepID=W2UKB9_9FLAO|nr:cytochrome c [Zhouia amylolytica]ETN94444.1 cytochrome c class i [Zhouia amylolytica AD3]
MKHIIKISLLALIFLITSCGGESKKEKEGFSYEQKTEKKAAPQATAKKETKTPASQRVDLDNKGIGPVKSVTISEQINTEMASKGEALYKQYCMACHKPDKKFIGPAPKGILDRRSPEWIMNMILNPEQMVKEDPLAKDLLVEFNGSPMANQNLTEEQARAVLEYFRTIK